MPKNHAQISKVAQVLESLSAKVIKTCIIDDECDSYSLNSKIRTDETSATYQNLDNLRQAAIKIGKFSYIGYTATPQANALIPITDQLSPDFCVLLKPGADYTGGNFFFGEGRSERYVRTIPDIDLERSSDLLDEPPESLLQAMKCFILVAAQGKEDDLPSEDEPRSMMVHPSSKQDSHAHHSRWVSEALKLWKGELEEDGGIDFQNLKGSFEQEWNLLKTRGGDCISDFETLFTHVKSLLQNNEIQVVQTNSSNKPDDGETWKDFFESTYASIIIGGNNLDRGFTVEGLTVTWLAREANTVQADTMQQRARFFGYKKKYESCCQIWMSAPMRRRFESYVDHEVFMHQWLQNHKDQLRDEHTIRSFILGRGMSLTRRSVYLEDISHQGSYREWTRSTRLLKGTEVSSHAIKLHSYISNYENDLPYEEATSTSQFPWCNSQLNRVHKVAEISCSEGISLLTDLARCLTTDESNRFLDLATLLAFISHSDQEFEDGRATVIRMDRKQDSHIPRNRAESITESLPNFQSGRSTAYAGITK